MNFDLIKTGINDHFISLLNNSSYLEDNLAEALKYVFFNNGQLFRPRLTCAVFQQFSGKNSNEITEILPAATAIELMHTYSLVHDDLPCMDNATLRREQLTCHLKYDYPTAVLVGDAFHTLAFQALAEWQIKDKIKIECIKYLSKAAGINGMISGQMLDINLRQNSDINLEKIEQLFKLKTGALFNCCVQIGATAAEVFDQGVINKLLDYAGSLGLAYQIKDDIEDFAEDNQLNFISNNYLRCKDIDNSQNKIKNLCTHAKQILNDLNFSHDNFLFQIIENF